ncbi:forkhead-associated (FHA) domain-containing protein isoform X2 [Carex rostrata]
MAEKGEKSDKLEIKIPVFSVLRNGCALKNIFLSGPGGETREEYEDMPVLMGRHPDCHVTLDHPSISRFHLEILAKPSIQKISIIDRSSVHGTWVSGTKIEPNIPIDIKQGDILRLGTSAREYRFQWLSLNEAYEMENPLPPLIEEKEETRQDEICQEVLTDQDEITTNGVREELISLELETVQQNPVMEGFTDTGLISGPVLPVSECAGTSRRDTTSSLLLDLVGTHPISDQALPETESTGSATRTSPGSLLSDIAGTSMISETVPPEPASEMVPPGSESVKSIKKGTPSSLLSRRSKSRSVISLSIQTGLSKEMARLEGTNRDLFEISGAKEVELEKEENFESDKENMTLASSYGKRNKAGRKAVFTIGKAKQYTGLPRNNSSKGVKKSTETLCVSGKSNLNDESVSSNSRDTLSKTKEKDIPKLFASGSVKKSRKTVRILGETKQSDTYSKVSHKNENFSSENGNGTLQVSVSKSAKKREETVHTVGEPIQIGQSVAQVLFENCGENENFASDKENVTPIFSSPESKYRPVSKSPARALFQNVDFEGIEEVNCENFASDKENCTPDSKLAQKLRQPLCEDHAVVEIEIGERKEMERLPFRVLFDNNNVQCRSHQWVQRENAREPRKEWIMIVDTGCLLGKESIKAIRLLQGLRGTRLIIPRIVIRELDCMKRREGLFRRPNKQASLVLEWIEECMEREPLWIHVQSSSEALPVAPTPPVTPTSLFGDAVVDVAPGFRSDLNAIFSPCSSFMEIVTPTSEDHVLECALLFKKLRGHAEVVLLSSSTTLKIKAMAEGLLCEEAKEFKDSLTNPLSKRFLWASSSHRGPTGPCTGDAALIADNYKSKDNNPVIARRTIKAAEAVKGLKLILLHNSHYGQTRLLN